MIYAGIGSRETPQDVLAEFEELAFNLRSEDHILRTGGAQGADMAFVDGVVAFNSPPQGEIDFTGAEIYLPWAGFNSFPHHTCRTSLKAEATVIARQHHPAWHSLTPAGRKLHARNSHIILGRDLSEPADFVICWTKGGKGGGGTGQGIRVAKAFNVPVFDFGKIETYEEFEEFAILNNLGVLI